jgi:cell division protein FtsB
MSQVTELDPVLVTPLRRPKPRAKQRQVVTEQTRSRVFKIAAGIVLGTVLLTFTGRIIQFVTEPALSIHRAGAEIRELRQERDRRLAENERLRRDIAYLNSNAGIEQEARRRGWVMRGEVALSIVTPETPAEPVAATPAPQPVRTASAKDEQRSIADRIREAVDTCLAAFSGGPHTR